MWAYVKDGAIKQTNILQTKLEINPGSYFPVKYANEWTKDEKEAYGVYEIESDTTNYKNPDYYQNTSSTLTFSGGVVKETWGTSTARKLGDTNWTQAEIDAGKAPSGADTDTVNLRGLTYEHKQRISTHAHALLESSDWYASRKAEAGTAIPSAIATYRAAVRTKAGQMETLIGNADTVAKLEALYVYNTDNPPTRPLGEWPDPVE